MAFFYITISWFVTSGALIWLWSKVFPYNEPGTIGFLIIYVGGAYIPYAIAKKFGWFGIDDLEIEKNEYCFSYSFSVNLNNCSVLLKLNTLKRPL